MGALQRKLQVNIVRIAGTPLEPHCHSESGDAMRDGWKSVRIGQSAASGLVFTSACSGIVRSGCEQSRAGGFAESLVFRSVSSASAGGYILFVVENDFGLFALPMKEWQNFPYESGGETVPPNDGVKDFAGLYDAGGDVSSGHLRNEVDSRLVTHPDVDLSAVLEADWAFDGVEFFEDETSLAVYETRDVSGFNRFHNRPFVQRLSREGVGASAPKRTTSCLSYNKGQDDDIVFSALKDAAAMSRQHSGLGLQSEAKTKPYMGDEYFGIAWPSTWRPVKNTLEGVYQYRDEGFQMIYNGEIGKYEGVRFIEQTNIFKGNYAGSGAYQNSANFTAWSSGSSDNAFFFGEDTVAEAIVVPEEIRGAIPSDYGRSKGIAWYYLGGFALTQTQARQARIVQWASAA